MVNREFLLFAAFLFNFKAFTTAPIRAKVYARTPSRARSRSARVRGRVMKTHPNDQQGSRVTRFFF